MTQAPADSLTQGRLASEAHAWSEAFDLLGGADADTKLSPEDLERLAEAAWWMGRVDDSIGARERAHAGYLLRGERARAARVAIDIAWDHFVRLAPAVGQGWVSRAERLLHDVPESAAHGHLTRVKAVIAFENHGAFDEALSLSERVFDLGCRFGDRDLQALGLHDQGRVLVAMGRVEEGMALMDEAMAAAVGGELGPIATGKIYCNMISICEKLADYRRAGEWTQAAGRWCEREGNASGFPGLCRVHRAEIMRLRGDWVGAEREALRASNELQHFLNYTGEAFYEIGEIRLRVGDLPGADQAFRQASELGRDPQPGLALLRLAEGKVEAACSLIEKAVAEETRGPLDRARLLPAQVEINLAAGNPAVAGPAADELESTANEYRTEALQARAAQARGLVLLAEGRTMEALKSLRRAWRLWRDIDLPYEAAGARLAVGLAYRADGSNEAADLEIAAAQAVFEHLGAVPDAAKAAKLLRSATPTERESKTLMFTDVVRSTDLIGVIGDEAWEHLVRWHDETLRGLFATSGGRVINHAGDGFFVGFEDAGSAITCAVAIQRTLAEHRRTHGFALDVRIGLHTAWVGTTYKGRAVHQAARIAAAAQGGEILAGRETVEAAGHPATKAQTVSLKGIAEPVEVVSVEWR